MIHSSCLNKRGGNLRMHYGENSKCLSVCLSNVECREEVFLFLHLTECQSDNSPTDEPPTHGNAFSLIQCQCVHHPVGVKVDFIFQTLCSFSPTHIGNVPKYLSHFLTLSARSLFTFFPPHLLLHFLFLGQKIKKQRWQENMPLSVCQKT